MKTVLLVILVISPVVQGAKKKGGKKNKGQATIERFEGRPPLGGNGAGRPPKSSMKGSSALDSLPVQLGWEDKPVDSHMVLPLAAQIVDSPSPMDAVETPELAVDSWMDQPMHTPMEPLDEPMANPRKHVDKPGSGKPIGNPFPFPEPSEDRVPDKSGVPPPPTPDDLEDWLDSVMPVIAEPEVTERPKGGKGELNDHGPPLKSLSSILTMFKLSKDLLGDNYPDLLCGDIGREILHHFNVMRFEDGMLSGPTDEKQQNRKTVWKDHDYYLRTVQDTFCSTWVLFGIDGF